MGFTRYLTLSGHDFNSQEKDLAEEFETGLQRFNFAASSVNHKSS